MKLVFVVALLAMPVGVQAQTVPVATPTPVAPAALTIDSSIETILADAKGKAILDATFPGIQSHPSYEMFKGMSLKQLQPYSEGKVRDADIAKVAAELAGK